MNIDCDPGFHDCCFAKTSMKPWVTVYISELNIYI